MQNTKTYAKDLAMLNAKINLIKNLKTENETLKTENEILRIENVRFNTQNSLSGLFSILVKSKKTMFLIVLYKQLISAYNCGIDNKRTSYTLSQ